MPLLSHIKKKLDKFVPPEMEPLAPPQAEGDRADPYSQGFKEIYSLETVDPTTIKRLDAREDAPPPLSERQEPEKMEALIADYIVPWMEQRGDAARHDELVERLEKAAIAPAMIAPTLELFDTRYGARLDHGCYCLDRTLFQRVEEEMVRRVGEGPAPYEALVTAAAAALALSELQVARVVRLGTRLRVRKGTHGLVVYPSCGLTA